MLGAVVFILGGAVPSENGELGYHRKEKDFGKLLDSTTPLEENGNEN